MIHAFLDGVRRVAAAPTLAVGLYAVTLVTAVPLGLVVRDAVAAHLDASTSADAVAAGVHWEWWEEFEAQADGLAATLEPRIIGFAAVLSNLSAIADYGLPHESVLLAIAGYVVVWLFLIGGIIDRLARRRRVGASGFFAACGTCFFRFARLAVLAFATYWLLFDVVHGWVFDELYGRLTRNLTVERTAFFIQVGLYGLFGLLVVTVNLVFDYAKIRAVVEDRRSMIGALMAAVRFVRRRPVDTCGLYLLNGICFVAVLVGYAIVAPGPSGSGLSVWAAFLVGQGYVLVRLFAKLVFYASQTAYFQSQLAHADYVATPVHRWPESPAAEAISENLT